jgi:hypothetical protein
LLKSVNVQTLVSFDVVSLFTNVPIDEALQIIRSRLYIDNTLVEWSVLQVEAIMELLKFCFRATYFQVDAKFCQQKDGAAMGSCLLPIVSNIYIEHFEKLAFDSAQHKPSLCLQYVDDIFVVWPCGPEQLQNLLSLRPSIHFTKATRVRQFHSFSDVLVIRKGTILATKVYRKHTHTDWYISFKYNHPSHVRRGLIQSLHSTASTICQE